METRTNILDFTKKELEALEVGRFKESEKNNCQIFIAKDTLESKRLAFYCYRTGNIPKKTLKWHRVFSQEFAAKTPIPRIVHGIKMSASGLK